MSDAPSVVVFDLGAVLVDWDPRHLYESMILDPEARERFLSEVVPSDWNARMDAGEDFETVIAERKLAFPEWTGALDAYWARWPEMLNGPIQGSVRIVEDLHRAGVLMYALTNWSQQTFPFATERFRFLERFQGIVVSGEEKIVKPNPEIYRRLTERYELEPSSIFFTDDNPANVEAARAEGWHAHLFTSPEKLREALGEAGFRIG